MTDNSEIQQKLNDITCSYYDMVHKYVNYRISDYEDACDIVQEVFTDLVDSFQEIEIISAKNWLLRVAHNKVVDYYNTKKKTALYITDLEQFENSPDASYEMQEQVSDKEIQQISDEILHQLTSEEKELHRQYFLGNATYSELSVKCNTSETTMRKRVSRLKYKLEKITSQVFFVVNFIILFLLKIFL